MLTEPVVLPLLLIATSTVAFGRGGFVLGDKGRYVAITLDGQQRAIAAGWSNEGAVLARYLEDGRRDPTFRMKPIRRARFIAVALDRDAKIVAAGSYGRRAFVARFLPDGSIDEQFGEFGVVRGRVGGSFLRDRGEAIDRFASVAVDSRNRIVVVGFARGFRPSRWSGWFFCRFDIDLCWSYETTTIVARFLPHGPLDPSFGGNGYVLGNRGARWHTGPHDELLDLILLPEDRIAAAGWAAGDTTYEDERTILVRLRADGSFDETFGEGGAVIGPPESHAGGTKEVLYGIAQQGDRLVACGFSFDRERHIRALIQIYGSRGELLDHAVAGARQLAGSDIEYFAKCAVDSFDRIVGAGFTDDEWAYSDEPDRALLARYRTDGSLGERFSSWKNGRSAFGERKNDGFYDLAIDRPGRIWAVGSSNGRALVARFRRDLTLDEGAR